MMGFVPRQVASSQADPGLLARASGAREQLAARLARQPNAQLWHSTHSSRRHRHTSPAAQTALEAQSSGPLDDAPSTSDLAVQMELQDRRYQVIELEGCEYLIATDEAGNLDLRDTYVHDLEVDIFARPDMPEELPDAPCRFAEVPWTVVFRGDTLANKRPWQRIEKVYLVEELEATEQHDMRLNLQQVFVLDRQKKDLARGVVKRNEGIPEGFDETQLLLRIRRDGLYLDRREDIPDVEAMVREAEAAAAEAERAAIRRKQATSMSTAMGESRDGAGEDIGSEPLSAGDNGSMPDEGQPQDPIDAMSENDFDGPEDTPAVDLGF